MICVTFKNCYKYFTSFISRFWILIIWIAFTCLIFWNTYKNFKTKPQYYYLRSILGHLPNSGFGCTRSAYADYRHIYDILTIICVYIFSIISWALCYWWLCISRGTAPVLTTCSLLVLVPVCRSLHTMVHYFFAKVSSTLLAAWLSKLKIMHIACASTLIIFSFIHTGAHVMNIVHFSKYYTEAFPEINLATYKGENPALLICTWTGYSGIAMLILLLIMAITSSSKFRTNHFNTFYITHHLFVVYLLLLFTHPFSGVLKEQSNITEHIPGCILPQNVTTEEEFPEVTKEYSGYCKTPPKFKCMSTQSWIWVMIALIIYSFDLGYRKYKENPMEAIQICRVFNKAVHLKLKCSENFHIDPGQYVLLQCHKISHIEWHPFTITKCPTKENLSFELLISIRGDWTKTLYDQIKTPFVFNQNQSYICRLYHEPLKFLVDGPFSSPMQEIKNNKYVICVAAGIGITSYVATLRQLLLSETKYPKRLHLLWLTRNPNQLMWYSKLLCDLQDRFWNNNEPDRLQIQLFVTRTYKKEETEIIFKNHKLRTRINIGRPNWKEEFRIFNFMYKSKVSLFCCGPKTLSKELKKRCILANRKGNNYCFIKEGF